MNAKKIENYSPTESKNWRTNLTAARWQAMWVIIGMLIVAPWGVYFFGTRPADVLREVQDFRNELSQQRNEIEGEILQRTADRFYARDFDEFLKANPDLNDPRDQ